jgi:hypothetical protein
MSVTSTFQWSRIDRVVVQRPSPPSTARSRTLWKSFRNDPGQGSDKCLKLTGLKSESVTGFIPES